MKRNIKNFLIKNTICPICASSLNYHENYAICINFNCKKKFPIINNTPVLIDESRSLFNIFDFTINKNTFFKHSGKRLLFSENIKKYFPNISINLSAKKNFTKISELLLLNSKISNVLIIGSGIAGEGVDLITSNVNFTVIESDVSFGPSTAVIADCHHLPFMNCTFDAVICQAVLEHVIDPFICVSEIYRVLDINGIIYVETPFMQQVHGGVYDFTRFTYRGHRNLLSNFNEIDAGLTGGPGMAFAWSFSYLLQSFAIGEYSKKLLKIISIFLIFPFKYLDYLLIKLPNSIDAASGFYFLGRKSEFKKSDREIINY